MSPFFPNMTRNPREHGKTGSGKTIKGSLNPKAQRSPGLLFKVNLGQSALEHVYFKVLRLD